MKVSRKYYYKIHNLVFSLNDHIAMLKPEVPELILIV